MSLLELFCHVDDFCQQFEAQWQRQLLQDGAIQRLRSTQLTTSEIMTIIIHFHQAGYRNFKTYYREYVQVHLRSEFPDLVAYTRFVELMPRVLVPLVVYLTHCQGPCTGIAFVDSTALAVCHNRRIARHKVFAGLAARGKTSLGWFFGFKLHLVVNDRGEILAFRLTPGNVDDRHPVPTMVKRLFGKLFGDRGYLSQTLFTTLFEQGLELITAVRKNMKNRLLPLVDKLLLRQRALIETINDQLKNISQVEHTRHRSPINFLVNVIAGLIAYCHQPKKPSLNLSRQQLQLLAVEA
jgi:HPt (histidine-containing phosphotransfer) domain-containing protein